MNRRNRTLLDRRPQLELAVSAYHAASALEFFMSLDNATFDHARAPRGANPPPLEVLAHARQAMSLSPSTAWETVSAFRDAVGGLTGLPYPVEAISAEAD